MTMRRGVLIFLIVVCSIGCVTPLAADISGADANIRLDVTLRVFSGTEDPQWTLTPRQTRDFFRLIDEIGLPSKQNRARSLRSLGYTGFVLHLIRPDSSRKAISIRNVPAVEAFLLSTVPSGVLAPTVLDHCHDAIWEQRGGRRSMPTIRNHYKREDGKDGDCSAPIVGPDSPPQDYSPDTDDNGCFEEMQYDNNCYDYGTDIVTNSFAKPGRGSGSMFTENTCDNVKAAAIRDGAEFVGKDLPSTQPDDGHHVALLIWPNANFHWIRRDGENGTFWSHKPGGTPVRNVDNNNQRITDPSKGDFSPWTTFCGYFIVVPSNMTIQ